MKRRWLMLLLAAVWMLTGCTGQKEKTVSGTGFYFDTVVTLTLYGAPDGLLEELWQACAHYEQLFSRTVSGSDVDRINRAEGRTVTVDAETWELLCGARKISAATGGAFSMTIAPLSEQWQFTGDEHTLPDEDRLKAALALVDDSRLVLGEENTVTLPPGMQIDLGGIAKGYIADRLATMIRGKVSGAVMNFGGNVYVLGTKTDGSAFRVGIADPLNPSDTAAIISVRDASVVTSGTYQRCFVLDGQLYHHILDPDTGIPADTGLASVTVVAENSMTADALATACVVLGEEKAEALLNDWQLQGLWIRNDGSIGMTGEMQEKYGVQLPGRK